MIKRLNQLPLVKFIELSCGNNTVLLDDGEDIPEQEIKKAASRLLIEYRTIINPAGMQAIVAEKEEWTKLNARIFLLKICKTLCLINGYDQAKEALKELSPTYSNMPDEQLNDEVVNLLREAEFQKKRMEAFAENENPVMDENAIRASFDSEIAFIMTYFKMQIDIHTINAAVYANIVQRAFMEIKLKMRGR